MHVAVIGAAGRTGSLIVERAVAWGHHVSAVVRDPAAYEPRAGVMVAHGDVLKPGSVFGALQAVDVVLCAVGPRNGKEPHRLYSQGIANLTDDMRASAVRRLVTISAVPASLPQEKNAFERYLLHPILWRFFGPSYADLRVMEAALRESVAIDWTIIRPPLLTDDVPTGTYRAALDSPLKRAKKISRGDLAAAMLASATDPSTVGRVMTVST